MPWPHAGALLLTLALAACASPSPSSSPFPASDAPATATASPTVAPSPSPQGKAGRPYDAATILAAMRESRRPGGVPDELETEEIAAAVADLLWTWDGSPWAALAIGGACGPSSCSLEVAGSGTDGEGTDLYTFAIDPADSTVEVVDMDLHGHSPALDPILDELARELLPADDLAGLELVSTEWLPPPDENRFWLAYRSGGEEGAPGLDVLVDRATRAVVRTQDVQ